MNTAADQLSLFIQQTDTPEPDSITPAFDAGRLSADREHPPGWPGLFAKTTARNSVSVTNALTGRSSPVDHEARPLVTDMSPDSDWSCFLREHGRVPMITDSKKPWHYRRWLLYYRLLLDDHPGVGRRWHYWCQTMIAGHLLREPIPQIHFLETADREVFKQIERWVHLIDRHIGGWSSVGKLLDWFLWGFGRSNAEPDFPEELNERLYREVNLGPMLLKPYDYLGEWIASQRGKWNPNAFYPTPHTLVEFMVRMTMEPGSEDLRSKTVLDPCVGSGRMLMHASNYSLRLYGMDIDPTLVKLTYLNGALYVPWILRPFPERFFMRSPDEPPALISERNVLRCAPTS